MPRNRTPVMWFEGGPLHGMQFDKTNVGRWQIYLEPLLRDGRPEALRTVHGNARAVRRAAGGATSDAVDAFYKLDGEEQRREGRVGRVYVFCTLLEQRARDAARQAEAESPSAEQVRAAFAAPPTDASDTPLPVAPLFVEPRV